MIARYQQQLPRLVLSLWLGMFLAGLSMRAAAADELSLKVQLVWGTDEEKPNDPKLKELDHRLRDKLRRVFKWKNYFEVNLQRCSLPLNVAKRIRMSNKYETEVKYLRDQVEIKSYGEGKFLKKILQPTAPLKAGEFLILAGDDKEKYEDAWFVVISVEKP
jgi:hypothetical protein